MTLTMAHAPLAADPSPSNYEISGPAVRLFFDDFPRRIRAMFAGRTVVDSRKAKLLHKTGKLPQLYVPDEDFQDGLLRPAEHTEQDPDRGDVRYWSVVADAAVAEDAVWAYPHPAERSSWLRGYRAVRWDAMDEWWDEDEQVYGHLRDPYHRVDVRHMRQQIRVRVGAEVIAETADVEVLSETGLPNRYYLPAGTVRAGGLQLSDTVTVCPYKGTASYWSLQLPELTLQDVAWSYPDPLPGEAMQIRGHLCFATDEHEQLVVEIIESDG